MLKRTFYILFACHSFYFTAKSTIAPVKKSSAEKPEISEGSKPVRDPQIFKIALGAVSAILVVVGIVVGMCKYSLVPNRHPPLILIFNFFLPMKFLFQAPLAIKFLKFNPPRQRSRIIFFDNDISH